MKVKKGLRFELDPNMKQTELFVQGVGVARWAYNWGLGRRIREYKETGKSSRAIEQHRQLNAVKDSLCPWIRNVSKCIPQEALRDLDHAYDCFFIRCRKRKEGKKVGKLGFPRAKRKKGKKQSFRLTGSIRLFERSVKLPRIGKVRIKEKVDTEELKRQKTHICSATVCKDADRWFVSLTVTCEIPEPEFADLPETIGIDVGIKTYAVLSDGTTIDPLKPLDGGLKKLKRLSRSVNRKKKGSKNREKAKLKLARQHRKIRNRRTDFQHKATTRLAKTKSVFCVESLSVRNMIKNRKLSRKIADAAWSRFFFMLDYKCRWYGSVLVKAPPFFPSSKTCSCCGHVLDELPLSVRTWTCPECGTRHDRDRNAALNLAMVATVSSTGSHACGDPVRPAPVAGTGREAGSAACS